jgi:hypothetical protein
MSPEQGAGTWVEKEPRGARRCGGRARGLWKSTSWVGCDGVGISVVRPTAPTSVPRCGHSGSVAGWKVLPTVVLARGEAEAAWSGGREEGEGGDGFGNGAEGVGTASYSGGS